MVRTLKTTHDAFHHSISKPNLTHNLLVTISKHEVTREIHLYLYDMNRKLFIHYQRERESIKVQTKDIEVCKVQQNILFLFNTSSYVVGNLLFQPSLHYIVFNNQRVCLYLLFPSIYPLTT